MPQQKQKVRPSLRCRPELTTSYEDYPLNLATLALVRVVFLCRVDPGFMPYICLKGRL